MRTLGIMLAVLLAACGGGGAEEGEVATTPGGTPLVTAGGEAVNVEAHNRWNAALEAFNGVPDRGWNEETCSRISGLFEGANDAQGGNFTEAIYMRGLVAHTCGNVQDARSFYDRALETNQTFCKARAGIGVLTLDAGNQGEALAIFQRALRDDSRCTEAYVNIAAIQRVRGGAEVRESLNNLRRALAIESDYLPAFNQMALLYLELAESQSNPQMLDLAGVVCRQAQLIDRDYAPIYNTWGLINVEKNNIIEATQLFQRAISLDPNMFAAYMNFGTITQSFRGYEDAKNAFTRAVELQPNHYEAHIGLGAALRGLGQIPQAQAEYERALALDANRPEAYFNLGLIYQDYMSGSVEDLRRAKTFYEQFLSKAGGNERYADAVENVRRTCREQQAQGRRRARRRSDDCRPGRIQNINTAVEALTEAARLQQQMEAQQRQQGGGG